MAHRLQKGFIVGLLLDLIGIHNGLILLALYRDSLQDLMYALIGMY